MSEPSQQQQPMSASHRDIVSQTRVSDCDVGLPRRPPKAAIGQRDHSTRANALALAAQLNAWWHARGYPQARFWLDPVPIRTTPRAALVWVVRNNLVNGLPPKPEVTIKPVTPVDNRSPPLSIPMRAERGQRGDRQPSAP
jgi:hypothetical protein